MPIQSSLPKVTRAATRLPFGSLTKFDIDFPTLPIRHSSELEIIYTLPKWMGVFHMRMTRK
jgi:hypothetical protein